MVSYYPTTRYSNARPGKCAAQIYKRDTYRYTGRTKSGFEMHYNRQQCSRSTSPGAEFCWQHPAPESEADRD